MYKLQGDTDESRDITQYERVDAASLEAAIGKLNSEKRNTRVSLIRAGHTLSGIVKHLGNDRKKISGVLRDAGIGTSEKNQLIAIAQVPEFSNPLYDLKLPNSIGPLYELCKSADQIELMGRTSFLDPSLTTASIKKFAKLYAKDNGASVQAQYEDQKRKFDAEYAGKNPPPFRFKPTVDSDPSSNVTKKVIELRIDPTKYQNATELEVAVKALETALDRAKLGDHVTAVTKNTAVDRANWIKDAPKPKLTAEQKAKAALAKKISDAKAKATKAITMITAAQNAKLGEEDEKKVLSQWLGKVSAQVLKEHDPNNAIHAHIKRLNSKLYDLSPTQKKAQAEAADPFDGKTITLEMESKAAE